MPVYLGEIFEKGGIGYWRNRSRCGWFYSTADMRKNDIPQLLTMDAVTLARAIKVKQVSCRTVMEGFLNHIDRINPKVNAIVSLQDRETLLKQADERDAQLARGEREQLKPEAQWEVEDGLRLSAMDVYRASADRSEVYQAANRLFRDYDYLVLPTSQVFPFAADVHWPQEINGEKMDTYHRWMEVCFFASLIGCPVINVPAGFNQDGLPMGVQIIGRNHADLAVLQLAYAYEQATQWVSKHPPVLLA